MISRIAFSAIVIACLAGVILIGVGMVALCRDESGTWICRPADTERRAELAPLYEWVFDTVEAQTSENIRLDDCPAADEWCDLARRRVINAVNATADNCGTGGPECGRIELPYLLVGDVAPFHLDVAIPPGRLVETGVLPRATGNAR